MIQARGLEGLNENTFFHGSWKVCPRNFVLYLIDTDSQLSEQARASICRERERERSASCWNKRERERERERDSSAALLNPCS